MALATAPAATTQDAPVPEPDEELQTRTHLASQPFYVTPRGPERQLAVDRWFLAFSEPDADPDAVVAGEAELDWVEVDAGSMVQWQWYLAGRGPHPYVGRNSAETRWMHDRLWWFRTSIDVPEQWRSTAQRLDLVFDGVDHDATVWVDGIRSAQHFGAFGGPALDVSGMLSAPAGSGTEVFVAVQPAGSGQGKEHGTSGRLVKAETFSRWINNPDLMTAGIWRPVRLVATGAFRLERPRVSSRIDADGSAVVEVEVEVLRHDISPDLAFVERYGQFPPLDDPRFAERADAAPGALRMELVDEFGQVVAAHSQAIELRRGRQWVRESLAVSAPRLWWPNGLGNPSLYELRLSLEVDGAPSDELAVTTGIRSFALKRSAAPRTADHWLDWQAEVNGVEVHVRGMNWTPLDLLNLAPSKYEHFLRLACRAGVQLIRVWGGGLIETDDFYELCDRFGLMVWQDFPLNTDYDCSELPLDVWEQQVVWSVSRLRTHPSLVVWCGGNEFNPYLPANAAAVGIMERTVTDLDPGRPFVRSCSDAGDVHPYLDFDTSWYLPLYRSAPAITEWGSHSVPTFESLAEFMPEDELQRPLAVLGGADAGRFEISHPTLRHHWAEFNPTRIPRMLDRARIFDDISVDDNARVIEAVQLGAAEIYETVAADFRASDVDATMVMPWVFNRPWPSVGMQVVDHSGRPTPGYYALRRSYAQIALAVRSPHEALAAGERLALQIAVNRDADLPAAAAVRVRIYDDALTLHWSEVASLGNDSFAAVEIDVPQGAAYLLVVADLDDERGARQARTMRVLRVAPALDDVERRTAYRSVPEPTALHGPSALRPLLAETSTRLALEVTGPLAAVEGSGLLHGEVEVRNTGTVPAAYVRVDWVDAAWILDADDNYFWLDPGEGRRLKVTLTPTAHASSFPVERGTQPTLSALSVRAWNAERTS